jgi:hypothetical protein
MKINYWILSFVVIAAVYVGLNLNYSANTTASKEVESTDNLNDSTVKITSEKPHRKSSGLTPEYLTEYLEKIGFTNQGIFTGKTTDIYSFDTFAGNSKVQVSVVFYFERETREILLIETTIDGSNYLGHDQKEATNLVNKVADTYFVPLAAFPYKTSNPQLASDWISSQITTSFSDQPKEKTRKVIGIASINIFGSPLLRTMEMDFGFVRPDTK